MALAIAELRAAECGSDALRSTPNACAAVRVLKAGVAAVILPRKSSQDVCVVTWAAPESGTTSRTTE